MQIEFQVPIKGISTDTNQLQDTGETVSFALNAATENFSGEQSFPFYSNASSNVKCFSLANNEIVLGTLSIVEFNKNLVCIYNKETKQQKFLTYSYAKKDLLSSDVITESCDNVKVIEKELDTTIAICNTKTILTTNCFKWSEQYPLQLEYKLTDCTFNLYFVNGYDVDRFIYFDLDDNNDFTLNEDFKLNNGTLCTPVYAGLECGKTQWYPSINYPALELELIPGGSKLNGKYSYLVAYSTAKGLPLTPFKSLTQGYDIFDLGKEESNKGIKINITELTTNSRYKYFTIACVETIKGITTYKQKATLPISQTQWIDVDNEGTSIPLELLLTKYPFYKNSGDIEIANNILFKSQLQGYELFNLQPIVNRIVTKWNTVVAKEGDYSDPEFAQNYKSGMRDEVYPYGIKFTLDNGDESPAFPLISRAKNTFGIDDTSLVNNNDVIANNLSCSTNGNQKWQIYNTAKLNYRNPLNYVKCGDKIVYEEGEFAYWESTERYPSIPEVWGELCGQPIRHFKFPDTLITSHQSNNTVYENQNYIFPIGISIKSDINYLLDQAVSENFITQEQRDRITGYKILRGNRIGNESITAKGLLYDVWSYEKKEANLDFNSCSAAGTNYLYSNYPFNDLRNDKLLSSNNTHYKSINGAITPQTFTNQGKYTFHSPDVHFIQPNLGNQLKLEAEVFGTAKGSFSIAEEQAKYKLLSKKQYNLAIIFATWISDNLKDPTTEAIRDTGSNMGSSIGSVVGGATAAAFGIPPQVGSAVVGALGGVLGGMIGANLAQNSPFFSFSSLTFKSSVKLAEAEKFLTIMKLLSNYRDYQYQYQAVGNYNQISTLANSGNKIRNIVNGEYLDANSKVTLRDGKFFNNYGRESSVYLSVNQNLPSTTNIDESRITLKDVSSTSITPVTSTENINCYKFKITASVGMFAVWGKLCTPLSVAGNDPDNNQADYEELSPGNWFIVGEKIDQFKTADPDLNITTTVCYRSIYTKQYVGTFSNRKLDLGDLDISVFENCVPYTTTTTLLIKNECDCNNITSTKIASYYASIKNNRLNQYGSIFDINWLETTSGSFKLTDSNTPIFGGDTFINRFSFKRKHLFFNNSTFRLPDSTDINYSLIPNVAYPSYFFDTLVKEEPTYIFNLENNIFAFPFTGFIPTSLIRDLLKILKNSVFDITKWFKSPNYKLDCLVIEGELEIPLNSVKGLMYLYYYGVPSYIGESTVNVDLRDRGKELEQDFYPHQQDLSFWLQEKNVSPKQDNFYIYDKSYSKQSTESVNFQYDNFFKGEIDCKSNFPQRVIYTSQSSEIDDNYLPDNYLINKALDYHDFELKDGKLISIEGIEGNKVLVRQENGSSIFNAYIEINTNQDTALLSAGNIFGNKPVKFTKPTVGYFGTQHKALLNSPFGHISTDSKRGNIFVLANNGQGLEEISNHNMRNWFKENLPFQIEKHFPNVNIDNAFNGIGLSMVYDNRFNCFYITKLDYSPLFDNIIYDGENFTINNNILDLKDKRYFSSKCWTLSYNFHTKSWMSFHSFLPNFYVENIDNFDSGTQGGIWKHSVTNKSFQTYYGKKYPFIIESSTKTKLEQEIIEDVNFYLDVVKYVNDYDFYFKPNKSFNKAVIYNRLQNSGLLELVNKTNDIRESTLYPIKLNDRRKILINHKEELHSFNQFEDLAKPETPIWLNNSNNVDKELNISAFSYKDTNIGIKKIRSNQTKIRLINDIETKYQYIYKGLFTKTSKSNR